MQETPPVEDILRRAFRALNEEPISQKFFANYYVTRSESPVNSLRNDIINSGNSFQKILFSGHRGSGKTTELQNLKNILEKDRRYLVTFIAATKDMNIADLVYTDLLFVLIIKCLELLAEKGIKINNKQRKKILQDLRQLTGELEKEEIRQTTLSFSLTGATDWFKGFFGMDRTKREKIRLNANSLTREAREAFNSIVASIEDATGKQVVIIVDDLEKVTEEDRIVDILLNRGYVIRDLKCHIVLTVPPSLLYSQKINTIRQTYGITHFLPPYQVRNKDGSRGTDHVTLMIEVARRRLITDTLLGFSHLEYISLRSGGL